MARNKSDRWMVDEPDEGPSRGTVAAAVVLALIALLGVLVVVNGLRGKDPTTPSTVADGTTMPTADDHSQGGGKTSTPSICGLPAGDQQVPHVAPATTWTADVASGLAMPSSEEFGPRAAHNGVHSCFAHSPTGAVFASSLFLIDMLNPGVSNEDLTARVNDDGNRRYQVEGFKYRPNAPTGLQVAGFRIDAYSADEATVTLVLEQTAGSKAGALATTQGIVVWRHGDWFVEGNPEDPPLTPIVSLTGFTAWAGA